MLYTSCPQSFWHQGLVSWKITFPRTSGWGRCFQDDSSTYVRVNLSGELESHLRGLDLNTPTCPTPCDSIDSSPPGSSVHGILQART